LPRIWPGIGQRGSVITHSYTAQKSQARVRKTNSNVCGPGKRMREINLGAQNTFRFAMIASTETVDEDL
jgi:hypothetical protein